MPKKVSRKALPTLDFKTTDVASADHTPRPVTILMAAQTNARTLTTSVVTIMPGANVSARIMRRTTCTKLKKVLHSSAMVSLLLLT